MSLIGFTSFGFVQNMMHDFKNTVSNSLGHCLRQMPQENKTFENILGEILDPQFFTISTLSETSPCVYVSAV